MLSPRFLPWWGWTLIVLALLLGSALTMLFIIRQGWWREMRTLAATLEADGRGITPGDLVRSAPAVDRTRQAAAWALMQRAETLPYGNTTIWGLAGRFPRSADSAHVESEAHKFLQATEEIRGEWRRLHAEGPVFLGLNGWIAEDLPDPARAGIAKVATCRVVNLQAMRQIARAFATEARLTERPEAALAELDAVIVATSRIGSLIDGMILLAISETRDEAWLEATVRGCDPFPWVDAMPDPIADVGACLRSERLLFGGGFYQEVSSGSGLASVRFAGSGISWKNWFAYQAYRFVGPHDVCVFQRGMLAGEELCRTGHGDVLTVQADLARDPWMHPITSIAMPNQLECVATGVQREVSGRRLRVAALLGRDWLATHDLPAALPEKCAQLAAATRSGPAILYTRLSASRFLLWSDPATPATDLLPAGRIGMPMRSVEMGSGKGWRLELDLSVISKP